MGLTMVFSNVVALLSGRDVQVQAQNNGYFVVACICTFGGTACNNNIAYATKDDTIKTLRSYFRRTRGARHSFGSY